MDYKRKKYSYFTTSSVENIVQQNPARENKIATNDVKIEQNTQEESSENGYTAVINKSDDKNKMILEDTEL